jgi:hypothetical protein
MLKLIQCLVSPTNSLKSNAETQTALRNYKYVEKLFNIAMSAPLPKALNAPVLFTLADVIRGSKENQVVFATLSEGQGYYVLVQRMFDTVRDYWHHLQSLQPPLLSWKSLRRVLHVWGPAHVTMRSMARNLFRIRIATIGSTHEC